MTITIAASSLHDQSLDARMLLESWGHALLGWILGALPATVVLLIIAIALDTMLARRVSAAWRIALYAPMTLRIFVSIGWLPAEQRMLEAVSYPATADHFSRAIPGDVAQLAPSSAAHAPSHAHASSNASWFIALALVYGLVVVLLATRIILARVRLARLTRDARVIPAVEGIPIAVHPTIGPLLENLFAPRIILPAHLEADLEPILQHEIAHLRRRDPWLLLFTQIITTIAWPILPVWFAAYRIRQLMEIACDEFVTRALSDDERRRYGHLLLDLAEHAATINTAALGIAGFRSTLRARITAIADANHRPPRRFGGAPVAIAIVSFLVACSGARSPAGEGAKGTKRLTTGIRGNAQPPVSERELNLCLDGRVVISNGTGGGWRVADPLPANAPASLIEKCTSAPYREAMYKNNWAMEPREALAQMGRDIASAYQESKQRGTPKLCPSTVPTPLQMPAPNTPVLAQDQFRQDPGWTCMMFEMSEPIRFQYTIDVKPRSFAATAHAQRIERNGRTADVRIVLNGRIDDDGELWLSSSLDETWTEL